MLDVLLACLAGVGPTLLLVEDVHWAAGATLVALRQLPDGSIACTLLVLPSGPDDVEPGLGCKRCSAMWPGPPRPGSCSTV